MPSVEEIVDQHIHHGESLPPRRIRNGESEVLVRAAAGSRTHAGRGRRPAARAGPGIDHLYPHRHRTGILEVGRADEHQPDLSVAVWLWDWHLGDRYALQAAKSVRVTSGLGMALGS